MTAARRWWCVGLVVLLLVATPVLVSALPPRGEDLGAAALLDRVRSSRDVAFSGYAETAGAVGLPENDQLSSLSKLVGDTNEVRVWWADPHRWRVATLRPTGETDLVHQGDRMLRWVYESKNVTLVPDVPVRLPTTVDLLPHELARRVLSGARASEVSRLPAERVAGRDALGLRLRPADAQSSVGRVDVYADRVTGLPLSVEMYSRSSRTPVLTSRFLDVTLQRPAASALSFTPPRDARVRTDEVVDLADAVNRYAARVPPPTLAGLRARDPGAVRGSVGVYGRGPTVLLAIPLWHRTADRVRRDLEGQPGTLPLAEGLLVEAAPLRLLLANQEPNETSWLLAGTVTRPALRAAARELAADRPGLRF
jgi:outer membrane lipoprotein-sorting protein